MKEEQVAARTGVLDRVFDEVHDGVALELGEGAKAKVTYDRRGKKERKSVSIKPKFISTITSKIYSKISKLLSQQLSLLATLFSPHVPLYSRVCT